MIIMECRQTGLEHTLKALEETQVPLVTVFNQVYSPAGFADDLGIYYFIPWIAKSLGTSIDQAINLFFGFLLVTGAAISIFCFFFIFKHWSSRIISFAALGLLTAAAYRYSDVYIISFFAVASITPLFVLWDRTSSRFNWKLGLSIAFSGLIIGYSNITRSHAGTGMLLFLISWLILNKHLLNKEKLFILSLLVAFISFPYAHFKILEVNRDRYLSKIDPLYKGISVVHPKWHNIYIGFGYLENKYGIKYSDTVSYEKVMSINPKVGYCSPEYEQILKDQCLWLIKNDPIFVLKTFFAKLFKLLFRVSQFANLGLLICLFYVKPSIREVLPFGIAALFYSLPGLATMPINAYVSGLTSIATLFGLYMICLAIEKKIRFESPMKAV